MLTAEISHIVRNAKPIVEGIGRESVDVYLFLSKQFGLGPILRNHVFQFVFRSFYRLDSAGLTPEFKSRYFVPLEESRGAPELNLKALTEQLNAIPNRKGQPSLQFSFVTKLANTLRPDYPIYDAQVARVFGFRAPYHYKPFDVRLGEYLTFYDELRETYREIISRGVLREPCRLFREMYAPFSEHVPIVKMVDFIFWSAGKASLRRDGNVS